MIYDFIIIWWWAAWLFASIFASKDSKKIILEKNSNPWVKVLLSGWERANLTNINIDPQNDYFWQNKKAMISILRRFSQYDTINFFEEWWINTVEEDRWRIILNSWDSKELLNFLVKKSKENKTEIKTNFEVIDIDKKDDLFFIKSSKSEEVIWKKVLISAWWKSFFQVWTTGDSYKFAEKFFIKLANPYRALSAFVTRENLSELSGISCNLNIEIIDKVSNKTIYTEFWPILFTHFGISWPIVFNSSSALGTYMNKFVIPAKAGIYSNYNSLLNNEAIANNKIIDSGLNPEWRINVEWQVPDYSNILIKLSFDISTTPKRIIKHFNLCEDNREIIINLQNLRSWKEAKLTWWWVLLDELDNNLQSKNTSWLYFAWECLDITWKTWWFSLQLAWSTWFIVWQNI